MIFKHLRENIETVMRRDPAARSRLEVLLCYPGIHAVLLHRVAHALWGRGWRLLARVLSQFGRWLTGIEIHPGAEIGWRLFIDHGHGVVIGETARIGNDVTLYQGVTLGGTSLAKGKRHPTLEDDVIVGAGAAILGPITVGAGARVGSNAVVIRPVPPGATMVGIPAREVRRDQATGGEFRAYAAAGDLPDPVARALEAIEQELSELKARLAELEGRQGVAPEEQSEIRVVMKGAKR